jgi:hypothetical protein
MLAFIILMQLGRYVPALRLSQFLSGTSGGWRALAGLPNPPSESSSMENMLPIVLNVSSSPSFFMAPNEILLDVMHRTASRNVTQQNTSLRINISFPATCESELCASRLVIVGESCSLDTPLLPGDNIVHLWPLEARDPSRWSLCSFLLEPDHICEDDDAANATARTLLSLRFLLISVEIPSAAGAAASAFSLSAFSLLPALACPDGESSPPCDGALSTGAGWLVLSDFPQLETCTAPPIRRPGPLPGSPRRRPPRPLLSPRRGALVRFPPKGHSSRRRHGGQDHPAPARGRGNPCRRRCPRRPSSHDSARAGLA